MYIVYIQDLVGKIFEKIIASSRTVVLDFIALTFLAHLVFGTNYTIVICVLLSSLHV